MSRALRRGGRRSIAQSDHARRTRASPCCSCAARACGSTTTTAESTSTSSRGIGAVNLGHAHPAVTAAVAEQAAKLVHVSNLFYVEHRAELAARRRPTFSAGDWKMFFATPAPRRSRARSSSRALGRANTSRARSRSSRSSGAFHGRTLAALAATGQACKQEAFEPLPEGFIHVPAQRHRGARGRRRRQRAAVHARGRSRARAACGRCSPEYLEAARRICDERDVLLMLDEVQTGFFRTGPAFAHQAFGVTPDVVTSPRRSPTACRSAPPRRGDAAEALQPGDHGSTFGGGPVVCAAGPRDASRSCGRRLRRRTRRRRARTCATVWRARRATGAITDVRGAGLMVGVTLARPMRRRSRRRAARPRDRREQHRDGYSAFSSTARVRKARD